MAEAPRSKRNFIELALIFSGKKLKNILGYFMSILGTGRRETKGLLRIWRNLNMRVYSLL